MQLRLVCALPLALFACSSDPAPTTDSGVTDLPDVSPMDTPDATTDTPDAVGDTSPNVDVTDVTDATDGPSGTTADRVFAGGSHTCAILTGGASRCWGANGQGQLGDGTTTDRTRPAAVQALMAAAGLSTGSHHTCARTEDGAVWCWGRNDAGQLGDGTTTNRSAPVRVEGLSTLAGGVAEVAAGAGSADQASRISCARSANGTVRCWGDNTYGQLGDGTTTPRNAPVDVLEVSQILSLAPGGEHACALQRGGVVKCWGRNDHGQLGDGTTTNRPTAVSAMGLSNMFQLGAGASHACARGSTGVFCWGRNDRGQLGDGTTTDRSSPVTVQGFECPGARCPVDLVVGVNHTCARLRDGTLHCWGDNARRQQGGTEERITAPTAVGGLTGVTQASAGWDHTCAVVTDGAVRCVGSNGQGQLGDGTTTDRTAPVAPSW